MYYVEYTEIPDVFMLRLGDDINGATKGITIAQ
jgi:hypothetical protein